MPSTGGPRAEANIESDATKLRILAMYLVP